MIMSREEMISKLSENVHTVTFNKVNGEERVMQCTLKPDLLPPATKSDPITQKKVRQVNEEVLPVFDVNKEQFRSFRVANVTAFV